MERLVAEKRNVSNVNNDDKKNIAKNKKSKNINNFFAGNYKQIVCVVLLCVFSIIFCILTFSNNAFFEFVSRPKLFKNSELVIAMISICDAMICLNYLYELFFCKNMIKHNSSKKCNMHKCCLKHNEAVKCAKKLKTKIFFTCKKIKHKRFLNTDKFGDTIVLLCLSIFFCLSFWIKLVWLCVLISFFCCAISLSMLLNKKRHAISRIIILIYFLIFICLNLAFYFIFLLN